MAIVQKEKQFWTVAGLRAYLAKLPGGMRIGDEFDEPVKVAEMERQPDESGPKKYLTVGS